VKKFNIPTHYKSSFIAKIKESRKILDPRKKDFTSTILDFGPVHFIIARHFGFCYGVENAIEISYQTIEENPEKRIYLLSQMIHNPTVNEDLLIRGIKFIQEPNGNQIIPWTEITKEDIVLIPAFGTSLAIEQKLTEIGVNIEKYDTTCPFVRKVWNSSKKLGSKDYSIIIHGKATHEETRATFSHSSNNAPSVVIKNMEEAIVIGKIILGELPKKKFYQTFEGKYTANFNPEQHLQKLGVINQTTMLASETHAISKYFRSIMVKKYGDDSIKEHFADTHDTLCYATNDNQDATYGLLKSDADLALVVGGYNSSNTTHLVELLEKKFPSFFISSANEIESNSVIFHFDIHKGVKTSCTDFLPNKSPVKIILTSGASCPDTMVDAVLDKVLSFFTNTKSKDEVLKNLN
jgi:4-hydroxy-3-methylbut-2-en-1-yl diphosphate reductase